MVFQRSKRTHTLVNTRKSEENWLNSQIKKTARIEYKTTGINRDEIGIPSSQTVPTFLSLGCLNFSSG